MSRCSEGGGRVLFKAVNLKGCERQLLWYVVRFCPETCIDRLRESVIKVNRLKCEARKLEVFENEALKIFRPKNNGL
jgi:hypothetical protein